MTDSLQRRLTLLKQCFILDSLTYKGFLEPRKLKSPVLYARLQPNWACLLSTKKMAWQAKSSNFFLTIEAGSSCLTWGHFTHETQGL